MSLLRRGIRSILLALVKARNTAGEVVSDLKGTITVSFPQAAVGGFLSPETLKEWILQQIAASASNLIAPNMVVWLVTPQTSGRVAVKFTSAFMANEADNGKQAHSGHRAIARTWIDEAQVEGVTLYPAGATAQPVTGTPQAEPVAVAATPEPTTSAEAEAMAAAVDARLAGGTTESVAVETTPQVEQSAGRNRRRNRNR